MKTAAGPWAAGHCAESGIGQSAGADGQAEGTPDAAPWRLCPWTALAFAAPVNPLGVTEPAVLGVSALLHEVIVALTGDADLSDDDRADLYRIALSRLTSTPALRHFLPTPADPRLRDVAALMADDPGDPRTLHELGRVVGASERTLSRLFRRDTGLTFP